MTERKIRIYKNAEGRTAAVNVDDGVAGAEISAAPGQGIKVITEKLGGQKSGEIEINYDNVKPLPNEKLADRETRAMPTIQGPDDKK